MGKKKSRENRKKRRADNARLNKNNVVKGVKEDTHKLDSISVKEVSPIEYLSIKEHKSRHSVATRKGLTECIKSASKDFDSLVKEDEVSTSKAYNKVLGVSVLIILVLIICFSIKFIQLVGKSKTIEDSKVECVLNTVYQYQELKDSDFKYSDKEVSCLLQELPKEYEYSFVTPVYSDEYMGVMVNNHVYSVKCNFVSAEEVVWGVKDKQSLTVDECKSLDKKDLYGYVLYSDGTRKTLTADKIELFVSNTNEKDITILIHQGKNQYSWSPIVK